MSEPTAALGGQVNQMLPHIALPGAGSPPGMIESARGRQPGQKLRMRSILQQGRTHFRTDTPDKSLSLRPNGLEFSAIQKSSRETIDNCLLTFVKDGNILDHNREFFELALDRFVRHHLDNFAPNKGRRCL